MTFSGDLTTGNAIGNAIGQSGRRGSSVHCPLLFAIATRRLTNPLGKKAHEMILVVKAEIMADMFDPAIGQEQLTAGLANE